MPSKGSPAKSLGGRQRHNSGSGGRHGSVGSRPNLGPRLRKAASRGDVEEVEKLLRQQPAAANDADSGGRTALHMAASRGHSAVVAALLEARETNLQARDRESGWTALHRSVYYGHLTCALQLLHAGATLVEPRDWEGLSPLDLVCDDANAASSRAVALASDGHSPVKLLEELATHSEWLPELCSWGSNTNFTLGVADGESRGKPQRLRLPPDAEVCHVSTAKFHSALLTTSRRLFVCGHGRGGRLGLERGSTVLTPKELVLPDNQRVLAVAAGKDHTVMVTDRGHLYVTGSNKCGQLGLGNTIEDTHVPLVVKVLKGTFLRGCAASGVHSAVFSDYLYTFGENNGQLGHAESDAIVWAPRKVPFLRPERTGGVRMAAAAPRITACITTSGDLVVLQNFTSRIVKNVLSFDPDAGFVSSVRADYCKVVCGKEDTLVALTNSGLVLLWCDGKFVPCLFAQTPPLRVADVTLGVHRGSTAHSPHAAHSHASSSSAQPSILHSSASSSSPSPSSFSSSSTHGLTGNRIVLTLVATTGQVFQAQTTSKAVQAGRVLRLQRLSGAHYFQSVFGDPGGKHFFGVRRLQRVAVTTAVDAPLAAVPSPGARTTEFAIIPANDVRGRLAQEQHHPTVLGLPSYADPLGASLDRLLQDSQEYDDDLVDGCLVGDDHMTVNVHRFILSVSALAASGKGLSEVHALVSDVVVAADAPAPPTVHVAGASFFSLFCLVQCAYTGKLLDFPAPRAGSLLRRRLGQEGATLAQARELAELLRRSRLDLPAFAGSVERYIALLEQHQEAEAAALNGWAKTGILVSVPPVVLDGWEDCRGGDDDDGGLAVSTLDMQRLVATAGERPPFADVVIVANGQRFWCHQCILAARCDYFAARLASRWRSGGGTRGSGGDEVENSVLELRLPVDVDHAATVEVLLKGLYGDPNVEQLLGAFGLEELFEVLSVANALIMASIKSMCERAIARLLDMQNVVAVWSGAHMHQASQLGAACMQMVCRNLEALLESGALASTPDADMLAELSTAYRRTLPRGRICDGSDLECGGGAERTVSSVAVRLRTASGTFGERAAAAVVVGVPEDSSFPIGVVALLKMGFGLRAVVAACERTGTAEDSAENELGAAITYLLNHPELGAAPGGVDGADAGGVEKKKKKKTKKGKNKDKEDMDRSPAAGVAGPSSKPVAAKEAAAEVEAAAVRPVVIAAPVVSLTDIIAQEEAAAAQARARPEQRSAQSSAAAAAATASSTPSPSSSGKKKQKWLRLEDVEADKAAAAAAAAAAAGPRPAWSVPTAGKTPAPSLAKVQEEEQRQRRMQDEKSGAAFPALAARTPPRTSGSSWGALPVPAAVAPVATPPKAKMSLAEIMRGEQAARQRQARILSKPLAAIQIEERACEMLRSMYEEQFAGDGEETIDVHVVA